MPSPRPIVAVTGGAGFIGSHTVDRLIETGHRVIVVDDFSTGKRSNLARWADRDRHGFAGAEPALEVVVCDISHGLFPALADLTARFGPVERIVHLAAQVSVIHSLANPLTDARVNYGGTVQVLEYARTTGVRKVVLASSAAVYGDVAQLPVDEDAATNPVSPYGIHKRASELALAMYSSVYGVASTALRFFNVYGPRQDPSSPYSGVISIFADRARAGRDLTIFGDGGQTRDFIYVGDVARALVAAVTGDAGDRAAINLGTGRETSVLELARQVVATCGSRARIVHAPARAGEILRSVAAVDRARSVLGVTAEVGLADGLRATLAP
ncbi:MAG: NAD-dependent epimerase/dehydratase family protein [Kofleriaceae bacterium]|jgi:UDP-glucose 4-epimerase|nr:NAD-dependent epimerase/dehydratase family protein [Kofleriaceae bacterium]